MRFGFDAPDLPPTARALRREVRAFLSQEQSQGRFAAQVNAWLRFDAAFTRRCGERGFVGITLPRAYGGRGGSSLERYVVCEEMLAAGAPVGMQWVADRQSGPQILRHGSEAARRRILPQIAAGRCCIGIGMSEPDAGSDLAAVRTRAAKADGGWRVNGSKLWTSHGHRAHYVIALVRTAPPGDKRHEGLSQLIIDMSAGGVEAKSIGDITGGHDFSEITFDDVFVADEFVLGAPGDGWRLVTEELAFERSGPERFLSTFPLLVALVDRLGADASPQARAEVGRLIVHIATLRRMSLAIAGALGGSTAPDVEAAIVKDLGGALEREIPDVARRLVDRRAEPGGGDRYAALLADAMLAGPSFTLRGGTREILRGIVARELGLR